MEHAYFTVLEYGDDGHDRAPEDDLAIDEDNPCLEVHVYILRLLEEVKAFEYRRGQYKVEKPKSAADDIEEQYHFHDFNPIVHVELKHEPTSTNEEKEIQPELCPEKWMESPAADWTTILYDDHPAVNDHYEEEKEELELEGELESILNLPSTHTLYIFILNLF